jgi:hypothetical protein
MDRLWDHACWIDHSFFFPRMHQASELTQQQHEMTMFPIKGNKIGDMYSTDEWVGNIDFGRLL